MTDQPKNYIVAAYLPCLTCGEPCVVIERFAEPPTDDFLDRYTFQAECNNCHQRQVRVGRDAFQRTIVQWKLALQSAGGGVP